MSTPRPYSWVKINVKKYPELKAKFTLSELACKYLFINEIPNDIGKCVISDKRGHLMIGKETSIFIEVDI